MSRKYKFHNPEGIYFISFAVQGWVDVFTKADYKNIMVENLAFCQKNKGLELFAWCIMTNRIHLITRAVGDNTMPDILRDFKKFPRSRGYAFRASTFKAKKPRFTMHNNQTNRATPLPNT